MMLAAEWGTGQVFWSLFWFSSFTIWFLLTIRCLWNIFNSSQLGGPAKALWTLAVIIFPLLGVLAYLAYSGDLDDPVRDQQMRNFYNVGGYPHVY